MAINFTPELLVRYIYRETTTSETLAIMDSLQDNYALREEYNTLYKAYKELPNVRFNPAKGCLKKILNYSALNAVGEQA